MPVRLLAPVLLVTALGAFFRLHRLDAIPPGLFGDEAADGLQAAAILHGEQLPIYIEEPTKWGSREPMYHYLMAGVFAVFGVSARTIRLTSALIGIATVPLVYVVCRPVWGSRVALVAGALLAVMRWHVGVSRIGLRAVLTPFWVVVTLLAFRALLRHRTRRAAVALGVALGLGFYTYPAYWVVPPALLIVLAAAVRGRGLDGVRAALPLAALALGAALVVAAPLIRYAIAKPEYFFARAARTARVNSAVTAEGGSLRDNVQKVLLMLHLRGDANARHNFPNQPMLDPITGGLFFLGLARLARGRERRGESGEETGAARVGALAFWLLPLVPSALSDSAPHALRAAAAIPAVCLISALGLEWLVCLTGSRRALAVGLVTAALVAVSAFNYQAYFRQWASSPAVAAAFNADTLRFFDYCAGLAGTNDLYVSPRISGAPQIRFLNLTRREAWHGIDEGALVASGGAARDRVYVSEVPALNALIEELYPHAALVGKYTWEGHRTGRIYRVPAAELRTSLDDRQRARLRLLLEEVAHDPSDASPDHSPPLPRNSRFETPPGRGDSSELVKRSRGVERSSASREWCRHDAAPLSKAGALRAPFRRCYDLSAPGFLHELSVRAVAP